MFLRAFSISPRFSSARPAGGGLSCALLVKRPRYVSHFRFVSVLPLFTRSNEFTYSPLTHSGDTSHLSFIFRYTARLFQPYTHVRNMGRYLRYSAYPRLLPLQQPGGGGRRNICGFMRDRRENAREGAYANVLLSILSRDGRRGREREREREASVSSPPPMLSTREYLPVSRRCPLRSMLVSATSVSLPPCRDAVE